MSTSKTIIFIILGVVIIGGAVFAINRYVLNDNYLVNNTNTPIENSNTSAPNINQSNENINQAQQAQVVEVEFLGGLSVDDLSFLKKPENYMRLLQRQRICDNLALGAEKDYCLAGLALQQVLILDQPTWCDQLILRDDCFSNFALQRNDLQLCEAIADTELKNHCVDYVVNNQARQQNNLALCYDINNEIFQSACLDGVISNQDDLSFCDSNTVVNNDLQDRCQSIILMNRAINSHDQSVCLRIPLADYKQSCLNEI